MSLAALARLGPHEITAAIGAGGMGELYRATDAKLGRDVAIKVLPAELAGDPDRLVRFEREARLLASLNHPGIAHLCGFESATLADGAKAHVLVMKLERGAAPAPSLAVARRAADPHRPGGRWSAGFALASPRQ